MVKAHFALEVKRTESESVHLTPLTAENKEGIQP